MPVSRTASAEPLNRSRSAPAQPPETGSADVTAPLTRDLTGEHSAPVTGAAVDAAAPAGRYLDAQINIWFRLPPGR